MKCKQISGNDLSAVDWSQFSGINPQLLLFFAGPEKFKDQAWIDAVLARFPDATLLGCSTAGEIAQTTVSEETFVLTAVAFDQPAFVSAAVPINGLADSEAAGRRLVEALGRTDLDAVVVFAPGLDINGSALIQGMSSVLPAGTPITGGLAGDNGAFKCTWTVYNRQISDRQLVALGFYGQTVHMHHGSFGGWQPFGPARKVTRSQANELFELDGEPALDVYKRYLGDYAAQLPASGLLFPFEMLGEDHTKTGLVRTILGVNHETGSLILAGDIEQNGYLRLMHASTDTLVDGAEAAARAAGKIDPSAGSLAILVSCVGRRLVMGERVDEEVEAVAEVFGKKCVQTGFYSYGEISPFFPSTDCKLHNQTMTITVLEEV
ncbi:MAG: hypothetical protein EPO06_07100 [Burkholderiaceae bacterium]|nr:MAG: hypothetical protein EPO06_07100 [Burkholderiaceae bacterium]